MITIKTAADIHEFLEVVQVFVDYKNRHKFELDTYLDKITELEKELDTERSVKEHLGEQKKEHRHEIAEANKIIDDLRTELLQVLNESIHIQNSINACLIRESKLKDNKEAQAESAALHPKKKPYDKS
jgi:chromosome segregation ATPase